MCRAEFWSWKTLNLNFAKHTQKKDKGNFKQFGAWQHWWKSLFPHEESKEESWIELHNAASPILCLEKWRFQFIV